ncbi:MAG: PQQ-like beta-propeller repeat protein, partial [Williamsia sp.]|nr:PQQ-like beta-propeller repeat protein [Williamsia sp.]
MACHITAQTTCLPAFIKEYGGKGQVQPKSITSLPDGNLIVAGRGTKDANSSYDGLVMKLSNTGTIIWSYLIGGTADDAFAGTLTLKDGSLLLYGTTASFGYNDGKAWLVHVTSTGNLIWSKQIGTDNAGAGRMKAAQLLANGDIVCTYNTGDSTTNSNAVVCRIRPDGNIQWTHTFDNGDNDSFTSLSVSGDTLYAGGFSYAATKYGVIVKINSKDGSLISSQTLRKDGDAYQNEVTGLEVYGGIISYGLWLQENNGQNHGIALVQTDMQGKFLFKREGKDFGDTAYTFVRRSHDSGFLIMRTDIMSAGSSTLVKVNRFASSGWGNILGVLSWQRQVNYALDLTPDGGYISAGYHGDNNYFPVVMNIMKMAANGETGTCRPGTVGMFFDTLSPIEYAPLTWRSDGILTPVLDEIVSPSVLPSANTETKLCDTSFCIDKTPLPAGCSKTYRIEYASDQATRFRDALTTENGEKMVVGELGANSAVVKIKANGDVAWTKMVEEFANNTELTRILRTGDGNWLLFGVSTFVTNHYQSGGFVMVKIDGDGNVIWTRHSGRYSMIRVADVAATPDNGFIAVLNEDVGSGHTYSIVIRYDADANIIWKKELKHFVAAPIYRSVTCNSKAVFLAYDSYDYYSFNRFGVDKLDLATGNPLWSERFTTGNDNMQRINRICQVNDTAYLFVNNLTPMNPFMSIQN